MHHLAASGGLDWAEKAVNYHPAWYFIYLFTLIALFAYIKKFYSSIIIESFQASVNYRVAFRMFKDNSQLQSQLDRILYLYYFMAMAFMLYILEHRFQLFPYSLNGVSLFLFNLALLCLLFFGRLVLFNLAGIIFDRASQHREYLYNVYLYNKLAGIFLLPTLVLFLYTRGSIQIITGWIMLAGLSGILILRILRGFVFSQKKGLSKLYMFLYLCALEIVPLVLLYRWLVGIL